MASKGCVCARACICINAVTVTYWDRLLTSNSHCLAKDSLQLQLLCDPWPPAAHSAHWPSAGDMTRFFFPLCLSLSSACTGGKSVAFVAPDSSCFFFCFFFSSFFLQELPCVLLPAGRRKWGGKDNVSPPQAWRIPLPQSGNHMLTEALNIWLCVCLCMHQCFIHRGPNRMEGKAECRGNLFYCSCCSLT